ncbi:hypothetical protein Taro_014918 [Colocasia esculenta]|uniref:Nucleotide-diphospho-sugar transferase domain-containing protein n=1 Tax=Colocasia esculenta TaxID=4460 RepID=A0A843UKU4_COLES|nr:hypothetical protein [Colocasia esculenta]
MEISSYINREVLTLVALALLISASSYYAMLSPGFFFSYQHFHRQDALNNKTEAFVPGDKLEIALRRASMANKTVIISVLNKAYAEEGGMLDLFLRSFRVGEGTQPLIRHLFLVTVDQVAFNRCSTMGLHCYRLVTEGVDFSGEELYMSEGFIKMMWKRTLFLGEVLRRGYSFIFTDMDVLWLRSPFAKLSKEGEDMQFSCDAYNGRPFDESNPINTGFYFAAPGNGTVRLFDEWYAARNRSAGKKEQDVLGEMKAGGAFRRLGMKVRFLDVRHFAGFCRGGGPGEARTMHANCCRTVKAKLDDLTLLLDDWVRYNGTTPESWTQHRACSQSWNAAVVQP